MSCTFMTANDMDLIELIEMHPADIRSGLEKRGVNLSDIGRKTNRTRQEVSSVVNNAAEVFKAITEVFEKPIEK
jgi:lambda repressor-like predicted transcriptional regulator